MTGYGSEQRAHGSAGAAAILRSLLVPIDLTPASDRVIGRLARLPLAEGALVTLVHVVPGGFVPRDQHDAERDAMQALQVEARHLTASLPAATRLQSVVKVGGAAHEITELARAQAADLIVMGRGGGRALRDMFLGSTAERVMRTAKRPVLAVRLPPRAAYHRPAMAIDLDESASRVFSWLLRLLPPPRPQVEAIHAFESPYEGLVYRSLSEDEAEERRAELRRAASVKLGGLLTTALADARVPAKDAPWRVHVRHGAPRRVVTKAVKQGDADLLALGTHGYSGLAHAFLGSVAGDLLRDVGCDVLVVPPTRPA
ncbi:universal stress protein [Corallococcus coralloides]|nr:universal stress protein [Corallococcus coralloides]